MHDPIVRSTTPFNAEPPLKRLRSHFVTPLSDFYVRCHGDVPVLSEHTHMLTVQGRVAKPLKLSIGELRNRFTPRTVNMSSTRPRMPPAIVAPICTGYVPSGGIRGRPGRSATPHGPGSRWPTFYARPRPTPIRLCTLLSSQQTPLRGSPTACRSR